MDDVRSVIAPDPEHPLARWLSAGVSVSHPYTQPALVDGQHLLLHITRQSYWHRLYVTVQHGERRTRYLVTTPKRSAVLYLVCRNGLTRAHIEGNVVEVVLGWQETPPNGIGTLTVTVSRVVKYASLEDLLSLNDILRALRRKRHTRQASNRA